MPSLKLGTLRLVLPLFLVLFLLVPIIQNTSSAHSTIVAAPPSSGIHVVAKIRIGYDPLGFAYDSKNHMMYVTSIVCGTCHYSESKISLVNSSNAVHKHRKYAVDMFMQGMAFDPVHNYMYVADTGYYTNGTVFVLKGLNIIKNITAGVYPTYMAYDPDNRYIYVTDGGNNNYPGGVSIIDTNNLSVIKTITLGRVNQYSPFEIAYDRLNHEMFVTDYAGIWVINTSNNKVISYIGVEIEPAGVAYDPANHLTYVTASVYGKSAVYVINGTTNRIVENLTGFEGAGGIGYDPANKYLYIGSLTCCDFNRLWVLNPINNKIVTNLTLDAIPYVAIAYDPANHDMFVTSNSPYLNESHYIFVVSSS